MKNRLFLNWVIVPVVATTVALAAMSGGRWSIFVSAQPAAAAEARNGNVHINNDGQTTWDDTRSLGRMLQNVRVTQDGEDFILYCDELLYNRDTNKAIATGKLRVESRDSTITGNKITADFNTKMIVITGNVIMKSHGTDDGIKGSDPKKPPAKGSMREDVKKKASSMVCDRIDYNYQNRQAAITGNIRMVQGKNSGTCERIVFDEDKNIAQLMSSSSYGVKFIDGKARTILTREVVVYIDMDQVETKYPVIMDIPRPQEGGTPPPPQPAVVFPTPNRIPDDPFAEIAPPAATGTAAPAEAAPATDGKTPEAKG